VNIRDLARFEAGEEVTPETLKAKGLIRSLRKDVKLLGVGELAVPLSITVHGASAGARAKVEAAGGTLTLLREPKVRKPRRTRSRPAADERVEEPEASEEAAPAAEDASEPEQEG
jgi:large subunit ribosomal protein L15